MGQRPFEGTINVDIRDSEPDWSPFEPPTAPDGAPNVAVHRPRRCRLLGDELLRRADRDAEHRSDRRERCPLHAVPHHRALLADPVLPAHRAQPHPQQHGLHHRGRDRLPECERHDPARERNAVRDPRRARLEHLHGGQVAPLPDRRDEPRRHQAQLALRTWLRALVRLPRRRDEPVVSRPRLRQPHGRPATHARRGLPPHGRHHRQGARVHRRRQGDRAGEAVLPLLRAGGLPRSASRAEGMDREVRGALRHGVRGDARADAGEPEEARHRAGRHRTARRSTRSARPRRGPARTVSPSPSSTPCGRGTR